MSTTTTPGRSSVGEDGVPSIAREIADTAARLVKLEIELVKEQARETLKRAAIGIGLGAGALVFLIFFIGHVLGTLSELSGEWLGWLIGDAVLLVITGVLAFLSLRLIKKAINEGREMVDEVKTLPDTARETVSTAQASWRRPRG